MKIKVFLQADLLSGQLVKIDFRRRTVSSTPVYIFLYGHLAPMVISVWKKKNLPSYVKMLFLVVGVLLLGPV